MSKGFIAMFREAFIALFHFLDAERISLAESNKMSAMVASNPPSGKPTSEVSAIALAVALDITVVVSIFSLPQLQEHYFYHVIYTCR